MSLIIFDWDDTLYPTSWILKNNKKINDPIYFNKLDDALFNLLNKCNKLANIVIITNAELSWIFDTSKSLHKTINILKNIPIISARKYNISFPTNEEMFEWKRDAFVKIISNGNYYNVISIGDSYYEYDALISLYDFYRNRMFLKPVLTLKELSYDQLIHQLNIINLSIYQIVKLKKNLDKMIVF